MHWQVARAAEPRMNWSDAERLWGREGFRARIEGLQRQFWARGLQLQRGVCCSRFHSVCCANCTVPARNVTCALFGLFGDDLVAASSTPDASPSPSTPRVPSRDASVHRWSPQAIPKICARMPSAQSVSNTPVLTTHKHRRQWAPTQASQNNGKHDAFAWGVEPKLALLKRAFARVLSTRTTASTCFSYVLSYGTA